MSTRFRGPKSAEILQPAKLEMASNLKAAKALGLVRPLWCALLKSDTGPRSSFWRRKMASAFSIVSDRLAGFFWLNSFDTAVPQGTLQATLCTPGNVNVRSGRLRVCGSGRRQGGDPRRGEVFAERCHRRVISGRRSLQSCAVAGGLPREPLWMMVCLAARWLPQTRRGIGFCRLSCSACQSEGFMVPRGCRMKSSKSYCNSRIG
jgi:hypothetical protein